MPAVRGSLEQAYDTQAGAQRRAGTLARRHRANAGDAPSPEDQGCTSALRVAQADDRTGVRNHQIGDGLSPPLASRVEEGHRRVDGGLAGVESEAHGRIPPTTGETRGETLDKAGKAMASEFPVPHCRMRRLGWRPSARRLTLEAH